MAVIAAVGGVVIAVGDGAAGVLELTMVPVSGITVNEWAKRV